MLLCLEGLAYLLQENKTNKTKNKTNQLINQPTNQPTAALETLPVESLLFPFNKILTSSFSQMRC